MSKNKPDYVHNVMTKNVNNGNVIIHEEMIIKGDKGIRFKYYHKENDKIEKISGGSQDGKNYNLSIKIDNETDKKEDLTKEDLLKHLSKYKQLKFLSDFFKSKSQKGGSCSELNGGGTRKSRKGSKNGSRKGSKKGSKKESRKGSKIGSKKRTKNGSRNGSRKGSRKTHKY